MLHRQKFAKMLQQLHFWEGFFLFVCNGGDTVQYHGSLRSRAALCPISSIHLHHLSRNLNSYTKSCLLVTEEILYSITAVSDQGSQAKPLWVNILKQAIYDQFRQAVFYDQFRQAICDRFERSLFYDQFKQAISKT